MGLLITLTVLTLLGMIPLGISVLLHQKQVELRIKVLMFTFPLKLGGKKKQVPKADPYPDPPKVKNPSAEAGEKLPETPENTEAQTEAQPVEKAPKPAEKAPMPAEKKPGLSAYLPFLRLGLDFLGSLRRKLRIEKLYGKVILAGEDPCDLAEAYGRTWAAVSALLTQLHRLFVVKDQDINIECDFTARKTRYSGRLDLTITVGRLLSLAAGYGLRLLKEYFIFKKRKGGAAT